MQLNKNGIIATRKWEQLDERFPEIEIDEFIVMPDHMHGIVIISDVGAIHAGAIHELPRQRDPKYKNATQQDALEINSPIARRRMTLPMVIGFYKMNTAKAINIANDTRGTHVWQRNYYEHIIRNEDSLNRIRRYIQENPIKWSIDPENLSRANE
ncbi:MAG: transposase [Anaerolineales bacterium]